MLQKIHPIMQIVSRPAPKNLLNWAREVYSCHFGPEMGNHPRPVIDDCCYDLIFYLEAGKASLIHGGKAAELVIPSVFTIHGLQPPYRFRFNGNLTFVTLKVQPWANASFFGSLGTPGVRNLGLEQPVYREWHRRLFMETSPEKRLEVLEELLGSMVPAVGEEALWIREVCMEVYAKKGTVSVGELSHRFGVSRQHLSKVFRRQVLYSLKHFILTVRMLELVKCRLKQPDRNLTELAHSFHYFDQSHFIRDFRKFSGMTPTAFFNSPPEFLMRH